MTAWKRINKPVGWRPRRGQICLVQLDKERPVLVISSDVLNSASLDVCVLPISTAEHRAFSLRPKMAAGEGGLLRESWVKCDQPTTVEQSDLVYPPLGDLSATSMHLVEQGVKLALDLN